MGGWVGYLERVGGVVPLGEKIVFYHAAYEKKEVYVCVRERGGGGEGGGGGGEGGTLIHDSTGTYGGRSRCVG